MEVINFKVYISRGDVFPFEGLNTCSILWGPKFQANMSLVIPADLDRKRRRITREIDLVWEDKNGNLYYQGFYT